ncbi:MAG: ATP-binding protein [Thermoflexibacter sp.]|nr:ATP-binding protein [Thermoflexibacter sp.]
MKNNFPNNSLHNLFAKGNEEFFIDKLLSTVPDLIYIYDLIDNQYIFLNDKITHLFGYRSEDWVGRSLDEVKDKIHPQDWEIIQQAWQTVAGDTNKQLLITEYRIKNAKEQWFWVKDHIKIFEQNSEGTVSRIIGAIENITPQKDAERDIQKLTRQYAYHNQRLKEQNQTLAEHEKKLVSTNEELLIQQNDLKMTLNELSIKHQELDEVNEELMSQQENLKTAFAALSIKNQELDKANEVLTIQTNEMSKLVKELSDRNFELDQFVYKISHDIRSPFTSILGLVNLMKVETDPVRLQESVKHIEKSVLRLDNFVKSMLNFARISREEFYPEEVFFYILIDECLNDYKYLENFGKIAINIKIEDNQHKFYSDLIRINSIFRNIMSNAIKYSNPYQENSFLDINIQIFPENAIITFTDNGIGIREELLSKVFGMFVRATERSDGSGLGLYIVKQSVERLNGKIEIDSEYGKGTTIRITLPNMLNQNEKD